VQLALVKYTKKHGKLKYNNSRLRKCAFQSLVIWWKTEIIYNLISCCSIQKPKWLGRHMDSIATRWFSHNLWYKFGPVVWTFKFSKVPVVDGIGASIRHYVMSGHKSIPANWHHTPFKLIQQTIYWTCAAMLWLPKIRLVPQCDNIRKSYLLTIDLNR